MPDDRNKDDELLWRWVYSSDPDKQARGWTELERRKREREDGVFQKQVSIAESSRRAAKWSAIAAIALAVIAAVSLIIRMAG